MGVKLLIDCSLHEALIAEKDADVQAALAAIPADLSAADRELLTERVIASKQAELRAAMAALEAHRVQLVPTTPDEDAQALADARDAATRGADLEVRAATHGQLAAKLRSGKASSAELQSALADLLGA